MLHAIGDAEPRVAKGAFVAWNAEVAGDATIGEDSSIWFGVTVRADMAPIRIGSGTNIQDGSVVHVADETPCVVGDRVTVGHGVILHGCEVGDDCLVGMGATLLNGSRIGPGSIVAAGALVTQGKAFPPRSMIMGSPAKAVRTISDEELERIRRNGLEYVAMARETASYRRIDGDDD